MQAPSITSRTLLILAVSSAALPATAAATEIAVPLGAPIEVALTGNAVDWPAVAMDSEGSVAVAWADGSAYPGLDGSGRGIVAQRVDVDGDFVGGNFVVNLSTWQEQTVPKMTVTADDDFLVTWYSKTGPDDVYHDVYQSNLSVGPNEARVNSFTDDWQHLPDIATSVLGHQVVVWQSLHEDPYHWGIYASIDGAQEFKVNAGTGVSEEHAAVAMAPNGNLAIVWQKQGNVLMRLYGANGSATTGEITVHDDVSFTQRDPDIAALPDGRFVVVWEDDATPTRQMAIMGRVFGPDGTPQGDRFDVSSMEGVNQDPSIATDPYGRAVVVWAWGPYVRGRLLDPTAQTIGELLDVDGGPDYCYKPMVAMGANDDFAVAWKSGAYDIRLRQYVVETELQP